LPGFSFISPVAYCKSIKGPFPSGRGEMRFAGNPSLKILRAMDLLCPDFYEYNIRKGKRKLSTAAARVAELPGLILVNFYYCC
jgi:hypothetical protein